MKALITGSMGLIGHATASHLQNCGWEVQEIDILPADSVSNTNYSQCDITDFDAVREQVRGCDAIVHMAALRAPTLGTAQELIRINTLGTFHVYEAAAQEGIKRVVQASSINAIGGLWSLGDFQPEYLPIDEDHPRYTTDPYAFSKQQIEDIGEYFWRRDKISSVAFRFPAVYEAEKRKTSENRERIEALHTFLDEFIQQPQAEQSQQLARVHELSLQFRAERKMELPNSFWNLPFPEDIDENFWRAYTFARYNLWTLIDVRDAAHAIELALSARYEGSHPLFVNEALNSVNYDSRSLAKIFFPNMNNWKEDIIGSQTLVSNNKAKQLIGFEPQFSFHGATDD